MSLVMDMIIKGADAVARGAMLLDEHAPGWYEKVDRDSLRIVSTESCILGQVFGSYRAGLAEFGLSELADAGRAKDFGFAGLGLDDEWREAIRSRLDRQQRAKLAAAETEVVAA